MQSSQEKSETTGPRDNMTKLYQWITTWEKYVTTEKRSKSSEPSEKKKRSRN
jgi:hypothetical protein